MNRRRFAFWVGFGLFSLGERTRIGGLDRLAAATMRFGEATTSTAPPEHWAAAENRSWRWYERETLVDGQWKVTGITTPINKQTLERYTGRTGYLDDKLVPAGVRLGERGGPSSVALETPQPEMLTDGETPESATVEAEEVEPAPHTPDANRRARHGRPPSKWLRSLRADEIRTWLKTVEVPEAGVSGMTYWTHLTRDHAFDPDKIAGLTEDEQAKLHAAAHYGY